MAAATSKTLQADNLSERSAPLRALTLISINQRVEFAFEHGACTDVDVWTALRGAGLTSGEIAPTFEAVIDGLTRRRRA